ncbi:MAG: cytochrome c biogenesis protein CcsA [Pseudomonadota bacterium]|nr:cytochrome c biogenesis protein CcsA [Pseudomonadota bacterium]
MTIALADIGYYLVLLCAIISVYGVISALFATRLRHRPLYLSAKMAQTVACVLTIAAAAILWWSFFARDYSFTYIFKNSSNDLPPFYTLTAFWSSLEGSHLLWTLLLSVCATVAAWTHAKDNEHIMPYVSASLQAVLAWMYYLALTHSDPFTRMLPMPNDGQGMNALLQNPYMAIHPPTLFVGYTLLAVPFAYGVAALCYGDITAGWLKTVRRWALLAFCFLTAGVSLGGRWAYVELGWAGYWAWDPVENSSLIPWLFCVCLLHSLLVQDKVGHLKRMSIALAFGAFFFSFFGTFITRSGVISSVHSFAQSPIGGSYLLFLAGLLLAFIVIYYWRAPSILPAEAGKVWGMAKESALLVTQFILLTLVTIVVIGTLFPIVAEAIIGQRISVQAPYFNSFAPYIGLALVVAIAIGNIMRYQRSQLTISKRMLFVALVSALPLALVFASYGKVWHTPAPFALAAQCVGIYFCFASLLVLSVDVMARLSDLRFKLKLFLRRNCGYLGGYVAHIGLLIAVLGFLGNYRALDKSVQLAKGEKTSLFGYDLSFDGAVMRQDNNATIMEGILQVSRAGQQLYSLRPGQSRYPTSQEVFHEIAVRGNFWHDLYVVMTSFKPSDQTATFNIHINPTVKLVWLSIFFMVAGGLLALFDPYRGKS